MTDFDVIVYEIFDRTGMTDESNRLKNFQPGRLVGRFLDQNTALTKLYEYKFANENARMEIVSKSVPFIQTVARTQHQSRTNE